MVLLQKITYNNKDVSDPARYPFSVPLFKNSFSIQFREQVTIISGDNGVGKSTLLELLARECSFNLNGGSNNHLYGKKFKEQEKHSELLSAHIKLLWRKRTGNGFFMRAETLAAFADYLDSEAKEWGERTAYSYYGGRSLNKQSHGESFLALFFNRFDKAGIYILLLRKIIIGIMLHCGIINAWDF
jgi:predicted ATPase